MQTLGVFVMKDEVSMVMRFASVGAVVTALHLATVLALVTLSDWSSQSANLTAFLLAFFVSFVGHHRVTFRSTRRYYLSLMRFTISAFGAYAASAAVLWGLESFTQISVAISVALAAGVIPVITYSAGRWWVF